MGQTLNTGRDRSCKGEGHLPCDLRVQAMPGAVEVAGSWTTAFTQLWLIGRNGNVIAAMQDLWIFFKKSKKSALF